VDLIPAVKRLREEGLSASKTAAVLSQITGEDRKTIYQMATEVETVNGKPSDRAN
jgi:hypothetical protein